MLYVTTRQLPTKRRQYEFGDLVDTTTLTDDELAGAVRNGSVVPCRFLGTAAELAARNPLVGPGQTAYETDTGVLKIGTDGATRYNSLPQVGSGTYAGLERDLRAGGRALASQPPITMITTFQPGHGWTFVGTGTMADDTTTYTYGSQSLKLTLGTSGGGGVIASPNMTAANMANKIFGILVRVDSIVTLSNADIYFASDAAYANSYRAVWLYPTTILEPNRWQWIYFTLADAVTPSGTPNMAAVTNAKIRAFWTGAGGTVINIQAIGHFPKAAAYPNGVVTFAFDDTFASQWSLARPVLDAYGYAANLSTIVDVLDTSGFLTSAQLRELADVHRWEVIGHAYTRANHNLNFLNLSPSDLNNELTSLKGWLADNQYYRGIDYMAWPAGGANLSIANIAKKFFKLGRMNTGQAYGTPYIDEPWKVKCMAVGYPTTAATVNAAIDACYANGNWLILCMHEIGSGTDATWFSQANLQTVVDHCASIGVPVQTMDQVCRTMV